MKKLILLFALVVMLSLTTSAFAMNVYTLTIPQLSVLTEVFDNPTGIAYLAGTYTSSSDVWFEVPVASSATDQFRYILLGSTPPITNLSGYTHYGLSFDNIDNNDESMVSVFLMSGGTRYLSNWVDLSYGASGTAWLDFASLPPGVDLTNIQEIGVGLAYNGSTFTNGRYQGDTVNISVSSVPEPGTLMLLGMGILGLFGLGKRKA